MIDFQITNAESMRRAIQETGIIPFFPCNIPGYSIRELTAQGFWFDDEDGVLGPWDWKIDCLQSGNIAYGKFLCGGKAAFATIPFYRELMNYRRSTTLPDENGMKILSKFEEQNFITIKEIRELLNVKKSAADAAVAKLQYQCRVVTGIIDRVYRGANYNYTGWQTSSFCTPESLLEFDFSSLPFEFSQNTEAHSLHTNHSPEESLEILKNHIRGLYPNQDIEKQILKILK